MHNKAQADSKGSFVRLHILRPDYGSMAVSTLSVFEATLGPLGSRFADR